MIRAVDIARALGWPTAVFPLSREPVVAASWWGRRRWACNPIASFAASPTLRHLVRLSRLRPSCMRVGYSSSAEWVQRILVGKRGGTSVYGTYRMPRVKGAGMTAPATEVVYCFAGTAVTSLASGPSKHVAQPLFHACAFWLTPIALY